LIKQHRQFYVNTQGMDEQQTYPSVHKRPDSAPWREKSNDLLGGPDLGDGLGFGSRSLFDRLD
jgi:hypothetical protein